MGSIALQQDQKPYGYVYKITNLVNGKIYVGQTIKTVQRRWGQHKFLSQKPSKESYLQKSIYKYGSDNFSVETLDNAYNREDLDYKEAHWIDVLDTLKPNGYNIRPGGMSSVHSAETCEKISKIVKAHMSSPERRAIISKTQKGRLRTPEQKEAMGRIRRGRKLNISEEGQRKRREIWLGKKIPVKDESLEKRGNRWFRAFLKDGTFIGEYINITTCGKDLGVPRAAVSYWLAGKVSSLKYDFVFIDGKGGNPVEQAGIPDEWVCVYDKNGNLLGEYISKTACSKALGVNLGAVSRWTLGKVESKKYTFKLVKKDRVAS